jgi:ABC-type transporter Mla subunit MlaD
MSNLRFRNSRSRTRPRTNQEPIRRAVVRGTLMLAGLGALAFVAVTAYNGVPGRSYDYRNASVPRTGNLLPHDPVRLAGRRVGQVSRISAGADGRADIRLQLEQGTPVPAGTKIVLRANGLLGARYVELVPGHSGPQLPASAILEGGKDSITYGVTDALDTFDKQTRGALRPLLTELGSGLLGHGAGLNDGIRIDAAAMPSVIQLMRRIQRPPGVLEHLPSALAGASGVLDENRQDLAALFAPADRALRPLVDRGRALQDTLTAAPGTLAAAQQGLSHGTRLLVAATALAKDARRTLLPAPKSLRATTALLRESPTPLARTRTLLQSAGRAIPKVVQLVDQVSPVLKPLDQTLTSATPILDTLGPYGCDIANFGAVFRAMTGMGGTGVGPNGPAMEFRLQPVGVVPTEVLSLHDNSGLLHRDTYPAPCTYLGTHYDQLLPGKGGGR